jgi:hypothetical protein
LLEYEGFILRHVVGCLEVEVDHVLELLPHQSEEQYPHAAPCFYEEPSKKRV